MDETSPPRALSPEAFRALAAANGLRMDEAAWARCIEMLEKIDVIKKKGVPHARFYTNRFVDQA